LAATIEIFGQRCTVSDGVWTADDPDLADYLNVLEPVNWSLASPGYVPDPDAASAMMMVQRLGGTVVHVDPCCEDDPPGRVYGAP
jgi:hypothetical protein